MDYVHVEYRQVLFTIPPDEAVSPSEDFAVYGRGGDFIGYVYPAEVLQDKFWSQPMGREMIEKIRTGAEARRVSLEEVAHDRVRMKGDEEARKVDRERRVHRISGLQVELSKKEEVIAGYRSRLTSLRKAEIALEREFEELERRNEGRILSIERELDDLIQETADLRDERKELRERREHLTTQKPKQDAEIEAITVQIDRVSRTIENNRRDVSRLRERKRNLRYDVNEAYRRLREVTIDIKERDGELLDLEADMKRIGRELQILKREVNSWNPEGG